MYSTTREMGGDDVGRSGLGGGAAEEGDDVSPLLSFADDYGVEELGVGEGDDQEDFDLDDVLQLSQSFSNDDFPEEGVDESDIHFHEVRRRLTNQPTNQPTKQSTNLGVGGRVKERKND